MPRRALVAVLLCATALAPMVPAGAHPDGDDRGDAGHEHSHEHSDDHGHDHGHDQDSGAGSGAGHDHSVTTPTVPGARVVDVEASSFEFMPKRITVGVAEDVTISLRSSDVLHDFVVQDVGHVVAAKKKARQGGVHLDEPGTYKFWCSVPGHRAEGMRGRLVVR